MKISFFVGLFIVCFSFVAEATPRFEADVHTDVTAKTVTEAKQKAISKAKRDALSEIVSGISNEASVKELNKLNDNQLEHFITGTMVLMEKTSDVRYIADLRISADGELLKAYMAENNMPLVLGENQEVLVIPVIESEDGSIDVWGDDNFWRQVFIEKKNLHKGNMNVRLIDKNLGNIAMIKPNRLFDVAEGEYQEIISFNRADFMYVLKYSLKDKKIYMKEYPKGSVQEVKIAGESETELADKCVALFKDVKKSIKANADVGASPQQVEVVYTYSRLADWMSLKQILDNNPQVQNIKIVSMANSKVHFNFQFSGVIEKLQGNLEVNGYKMRKEGEYYVIY